MENIKFKLHQEKRKQSLSRRKMFILFSQIRHTESSFQLGGFKVRTVEDSNMIHYLVEQYFRYPHTGKTEVFHFPSLQNTVQRTQGSCSSGLLDDT